MSTAVELPTLDIVIVNWNTGGHLRGCLESIDRASRDNYELGRIVVVDNASSDDSLRPADESQLPVVIVRNTDNRGFAAACNQGARECDSELLLFLNPDARLFPDSLDRTAEFMLDPAHSTIGICGARMVDDGGGEEFSCWHFPTLWMWAAKILGLTHAFPGRIPQQRMTPEELVESRRVDQVIGAYFFVRKDLFDALGGFDERFFLYLEDVDLSLRATRLGYSSYFLSDVHVHHAGGASSEQVRGRRLFYLLRSRTEYARKHWPRWQATVLVALMLFVEFPVRSLVALSTKGRGDSLASVGEAALRYARYLARGGLANRVQSP